MDSDKDGATNDLEFKAGTHRAILPQSRQLKISF